MSEQREQPEPKRCECGACEFEAGPMAWYWQPMQEKMLRRVHEYSHLRIYPNDSGVAHCPGECGCRLSVVDGKPRVGLSVRAVIEQLREADRAKSDDDKLYSPPYFHGRHIAYEHAIKLLGGETDEHDA